jgi:NAD(P)-dependent dehydrogenase (short-subunit alcohol dehydrogenase family)
MIPNLKIDYVVLNAGVLRYPNVSPNHIPKRAALTLSESHRTVRSNTNPTSNSNISTLTSPPRSFDEFAFHLHTNTIGPIVFMSSDSGSHGNFREMEDGFAAYAASKAALNMAVRHLAAELKRKDDDTIILAMHPGEVATDMANVQLPWEVQGIISAEESVRRMIEVIKSKGIQVRVECTNCM